MTVIVGLVGRGQVWLGADRQVSTNHGAKDISAEPKLIQRGPLLLAVAGYSAHDDFMEVWPGLEAVESPGDGSPEAWERYMRRAVVPDMVLALEARGLAMRTDGRLDIGFSALLARAGRLYLLDGMGALSRCLNYRATGSGAAEAMGALHVLVKGNAGPESVYSALCAAAAHDDGCGPPFDVWGLGPDAVVVKHTRIAE